MGTTPRKGREWLRPKKLERALTSVCAKSPRWKVGVLPSRPLLTQSSPSCPFSQTKDLLPAHLEMPFWPPLACLQSQNPSMPKRKREMVQGECSSPPQHLYSYKLPNPAVPQRNGNPALLDKDSFFVGIKRISLVRLAVLGNSASPHNQHQGWKPSEAAPGCVAGLRAADRPCQLPEHL